jgi:uncharacterized integral membrane protein
MVEEKKNNGEGKGSDARDAAHVIGIVVLVALLVAFVVDNTRRVKVGFVFVNHDTRLIYVLVITFALGILVDRLWQAWRKRREHN